jgi:rsbT co-antagonist protein RsbR
MLHDSGKMADMHGPEAGAAAELSRLRARLSEVEEALRWSEEARRLIAAFAPGPMAILDREMRYISCSQRWLDDFKLTDEDIRGRSHYEMFPDIPERWREIHQRCLAGASEESEEDSFPRADGRVEWVRWKVFPWRRDGGEIGGIVITTEFITAQKEMELRLAAQQEAIRRLSTPIIPISDAVLVMPLIGTLDADRSRQAMEALLGELVNRQARTAILDVTGVPEVDEQAASAVLKIAQGARLLGAEVVLTGIRPEVAQALVSLGVDLGQVVTRRDLQSGVAFATRAR